ncbi:type II secretion system protein [Natronomonas marina]|uniref:type II secretion system protein n=1 Tax=Natronomonas marina TaxID=2961939 RepID=UPI0020C9C37F|nr:type II secretion system protein [Natronomonas marina]
MSLLSRLASRSPRETAPSELGEVAPFLGREPLEYAVAADAAGLFVGALLLVAALVVGQPLLLLVALGGAYGTVALVRGGAIAAANARRSRTLGSAPELVSRAVLQTRVAPTAEGAAAFAAETEGRLGDRLAEHVRRARGTPRSGLGSFADAWRDSFPALHRSLTLVDAAAGAPDEERDRALDRAMAAILDGTRDRASDAADAIRGPATALYAFGVLLPLALVGVLPAAGAAGLEATLPAVVVLYDLALPVVLICASAWLLAGRPVAFPPAAVGRDHRDVPTRRWPALAAGGAVGVAAWVFAGRVLTPWSAPLATVGLGTGTALIALYRPVVRVRERADRLDEALPDALYLVGRRVADGIAVERAVADAADELDGVARDVFGAAARRQSQLRVGVETAFDGEYGALEAVPSQRARGAARLLGAATREGPPAGRALVETADHLDDLRRVERDARRDLARVTSTLGNTAAFFGPLVGGATVALADSVGTTAALEGGAPETAGLGLAVGAYVLLLAVILTALSTGLSRGLDRATVGYRAGAALVAATVTYVVAFRATATVAGGL